MAVSLEEKKVSDQTRGITFWLEATDPSVNYVRAVEEHRTGTGTWFLRGAHFRKWKAQLKSFLWLHGMSGCGKTTLSAVIIGHLLREDSRPTIYFYFDFSNPKKQHYKDMLRSLLLQLYHKSSIARGVVQACYDSHEKGVRQPALGQLKVTLNSVLEQLQGVNIILDGLDEAQSPNEMVQWWRSIHSTEALKVRLLVTSRTQVVNWSREEDIVPLQPQSLNEDIQFYTRLRLYSEEFEHWGSQEMLRDEVETTICKKAGGM